MQLTYNEDGQLTDRGETAEAEAIMSLLTDDWKYPVVESDLDPADPLVNTSSEYMYQMATIAYHTLHGTQTVVLEEDVEYDGQLYKAGTYEFDVDGKYWTDFDREHPIEGIAREQAWTGTAHGLVGELGVGTVTHSTLQLGLAFSGLLAGLGLTFLLAGLGVAWVAQDQEQPGRDSRSPSAPESSPESEPPDSTALGCPQLNEQSSPREHRHKNLEWGQDGAADRPPRSGVTASWPARRGALSLDRVLVVPVRFLRIIHNRRKGPPICGSRMSANDADHAAVVWRM